MARRDKFRASRAFGTDQSLLRRKKIQEEAARSEPKESSSIGETILTPIGGIVGLAVGGTSGIGAGTNIGGGIGGLFDAGATSDPDEAEAKALSKTQQLIGGSASAAQQASSSSSQTLSTDKQLSDEEIDQRLRNLFIKNVGNKNG